MKKTRNKKWILGLAAVLVLGAGVWAVRAGSNKDLPPEQAPNTYDGLRTALQGEVTAQEKYVLFAQAAAEEGNTEIQRLFLAAADAEQIHIDREFAHLNTFDVVPMPQPEEIVVGSSAENLASCVMGEAYEADQMYPEFEQRALEEGHGKAAKTFAFAGEAEKSHQIQFAEILERLNTQGSALEETDYCVCPVCGKIEPVKSQVFCSVCGTPGFLWNSY